MHLALRSVDPIDCNSRILGESTGLARDQHVVVRGLLVSAASTLEGAMDTKSALILIAITAPACVTGEEGDGVLSHEAFVQKYIGVTHDAAGNEQIYYDWDVRLASWDKVDELYAAYRTAKLGGESVSEAAVDTTLFGTDNIWGAADRGNLTFCVSNDFGGNKQAVIDGVSGAGAAWSTASNGVLQFIYHPEEDANCTNANNNVTFNVIPIDENSGLFASTFFPNNARADRQFLVNVRNALNPQSPFPFVGIARHELGHVIGLRHETARLEKIADEIIQFGVNCFENAFIRDVTAFDDFSVMVTPACVGLAGLKNTQLVLSQLDGEGVRALYR
jgi:hypothetical protein